ncbi:MAG: PhoD-like phosphatase N-terminal domain-containing protein, partial [Solirubrobacteraceae bacterium]
MRGEKRSGRSKYGARTADSAPRASGPARRSAGTSAAVPRGASEDLAHVVASGTAAVDAAADFTVHKRVSGAFLEPGEQYYYRFRTAADSSPVGR